MSEIARAERLYEELLWAREDLQTALVQFRRALNGQDPRHIAEHRGEFNGLLDGIEAQGYV